MKKIDILFIISGIFAFAYFFARAFYVPPYFDEINTFFIFIQKCDFIPFYAPLDANNHFINSLFSFIFYKLLGENFFVLRLANVLSAAVFMIYLWKIGNFFQSKFVGFSLFIILITTTYFTDFFILSRGYGISMAFLMATIFHLNNFSITLRIKEVYFSLLFSVFAIWSNLALAIPVLVVWGLILIIYIVKYSVSSQKFSFIGLALPYLLFFTPLLFAILYLFELKDAGSLYFGSDGGLIDAVFIRLSSEIAASHLWGRIMFFVLVSIYFVSLLFNVFQKQLRGNNLLVQVTFWSIIVGYVLMHNILGVNYPQERAALHIYLLFILSLFFAIDSLQVRWLKYPFTATALVVTIQFFALINFSHILHWKDQTVPHSFYQQLYDWQMKTGVKPAITGHGLIGKTLDYYDYVNEGKLNSTKDEPSLNNVSDFLITNRWASGVPNYDTLLYVKETSVALLKRKEFIEWNMVFNSLNTKDTLVVDSFYTIFRLPAAEYKNHPFSFEFSFNLQTANYPLTGLIMFYAVNSNEQKVVYNDINLQMLKPSFKQKSKVQRKLCYNSIPDDAERIELVLWIIDNKSGVSLSDINVKLYLANDCE